MRVKRKTYIACKMSAGDNDPTKGGFKTEDEAWDYIYDRSCDACKQDPEHDACAAEWGVFVED